MFLVKMYMLEGKGNGPYVEFHFVYMHDIHFRRTSMIYYILVCEIPGGEIHQHSISNAVLTIYSVVLSNAAVSAC